MLDTLLHWLQATPLAATVGQSIQLTSWLSAVHVLAFSFVIGSALLANLRLAGALLAEAAARDVVTAANRGIVIGLTISVATGIPLFAAKATEAAANGWFQLKMLLLLCAVVFELVGAGRVVLRAGIGRTSAFGVAVVGVALWSGLALAACAFILLE